MDAEMILGTSFANVTKFNASTNSFHSSTRDPPPPGLAFNIINWPGWPGKLTNCQDNDFSWKVELD